MKESDLSTVAALLLNFLARIITSNNKEISCIGKQKVIKHGSTDKMQKGYEGCMKRGYQKGNERGRIGDSREKARGRREICPL